MFEKGLAIRRSVLGEEYVDNAIKTADDFSRPLQELVTQYCWGEIWGRPGLDRKTRSLINLAMISALNRPHEVKMHIKGGAQQRPHQRSDSGSVPAGRHLLWRAGGRGQFPPGA